MTPDIRVIWRGPESLDDALAALDYHGRTEVHLQAEYHHALCTHLQRAEPGAPETVDVVGDARLLDLVAGIKGLEEIAQLAARARELGARVAITSPTPTLRIARR